MDPALPCHRQLTLFGDVVAGDKAVVAGTHEVTAGRRASRVVTRCLMQLFTQLPQRHRPPLLRAPRSVD